MYKFIIVDDEALIIRGMLKKIKAANLEDKLIFVGEANNGEDGLELIQRVDPDIILTDMRMPEMDGKSFLKLLQQDYPEKKVIVISGYSDFEYMKEAISAKVVGYLLKPFSREEIKETIGKAICLLEEEQKAQQKLEFSEIEKEEMSYSSDLQSLCNMILGIHNKQKEPSFRSSKLQILKTEDRNRFILMTMYSTSKLGNISDIMGSGIYIPHSHNDHLGFLLLFHSDNEQEDIDKIASQTAKHFSNEVIMGVSRLKDSLMDLNEAYEETIRALNARCINENQKISNYSEEKPSSFILQWDQIDELLFFIESGNASEVRTLTSGLFDFFYTIPSITISEIKSTCQSLIHDVREILYSYFDAIGNNSSSSSFDAMLAVTFDIQTIKAYLLQVLPSIAEMLNDKSVYSSENLIDNIKTYIQKNYSKKLTLDKISSLFFINPSYCSFLFKEKTGINFIEHVNKVRIDEAKILLKSTELKVYKIAKVLGFDNAKYFFRVFKKQTGYTPEEYRLTLIELQKNKQQTHN